MLFRTFTSVMIVICLGCGGSSDAPRQTLNAKKIANGFYLENNNKNNALIVSDSMAFAYSRLETQPHLSKVISILPDSTIDGLHKDLSQNIWIPVEGSFNETQYRYQCKNTSDAGNVCINALKKINYSLDPNRIAQRPANTAINKTYHINENILEFSGDHTAFTLNFDNGSFFSRSFTSQVTSWGSYHLVPDISNERAIITFYTLSEQSYFDLLIYTHDESFKLAGIKIEQ